MDDDRLARAREGDLDAFIGLARPRAGRLLGLATIAAGDPQAGALAAASAFRLTWRDLRRLHDPADLDVALERALARHLPRRRAGLPATDPAPATADPANLLGLALRDLAPGDRLALGRCLDPAPDRAAFAVAGRAGVEVEAPAEAAPGRPGRLGSAPAPGGLDPLGEIVDLDGPLAGWDLPRLRTALAAAAGPLDASAVLDDLRARLAGTSPDTGPLATLRALLPGPATLARGSALALAAIVGAGILAGNASPPGAPGTAGTAGGAANPGATAAPTAGATGPGFLFPKRVDGALVRSVAQARALAEAGMPTGTTIAVAGWLATPALAGACLAGARDVGGPREPGAAFCRRSVVLRGSSAEGRSLSLQLPPGTPSLPIDDAVDARQMPVAVVALVESGSLRSEPCWPTDNGCGRALVLERLLWVDGVTTDVAIAELDAEGIAPPRLSAAEVQRLAETAIADRGRVVSVIRVPAAQRGSVAPGADDNPVAGAHAWIVRVRSPMVGTGTDPETRLDLLWWLMVDDATGRTSTGSPAVAGLPGHAAGPLPG